VPNLRTDRPGLVPRGGGSVDVRRLMYQPLICVVGRRDGRGDNAGGFAAAFSAELFQGASNALIDRMRADSQANSDFLAAQMPVYQQEALDLAKAKTSYRRSRIDPANHFLRLLKRHLGQHFSFQVWNHVHTY